MDEGPRLVVVAHPRSGSNSLVEILDCHPELTLLDEPLNEDFSSWLPANPDYRARVTDVTSLDRVVNGILADYSGFKVHTYQLEMELLAHLLCRRDLYVVFLQRRNLLEAVVSNLIAEQTGLWAAWDRERALEEYYTDLAPYRCRTFLDPACEQARHLGDPCRAQVGPPLRGVDVTQVALAVELRERVEERTGRGVSLQRGGNVLGKITALRPFG